MKTISNRARQALNLFDQCNDVAGEQTISPTHQESQIVIRDLRGRFKSWCGNLGALQAGHASLDWRLRDSKNLQLRVFSGVEGLIEDLNDCE